MEGSREEQRPDDSSIKPVSSLRSHFEAFQPSASSQNGRKPPAPAKPLNLQSQKSTLSRQTQGVSDPSGTVLKASYGSSATGPAADSKSARPPTQKDTLDEVPTAHEAAVKAKKQPPPLPRPRRGRPISMFVPPSPQPPQSESAERAPCASQTLVSSSKPDRTTSRREQSNLSTVGGQSSHVRSPSVPSLPPRRGTPADQPSESQKAAPARPVRMSSKPDPSSMPDESLSLNSSGELESECASVNAPGPPIPISTKPKVGGVASMPAYLNGHASRSETSLTEERPSLPPRPRATQDDNQITHSPAASRPSALQLGFSAQNFKPPPSRSARAISVSSQHDSQHKTGVQAVAEIPKVSNIRVQERPAVDTKREVAMSSQTSTPGQPAEFPDISKSKRRPPIFNDGPKFIATGYDARNIDICSELVCAAGTVLRAWNVLSGKMLMSIHQPESIKVTTVQFKPARNIEADGLRLWVGNNFGEVQEIDVVSKKVVAINRQAHARREVLKIYTDGAEIWSLDDSGQLYVWPATEDGSPSLDFGIMNSKLPRGHSASVVVDHHLWLAIGKDINVFKPTRDPKNSGVRLTESPLSQPGVGDITAATVLGGNTGNVIFGHTDGKVTCYSRKNFTCIGIVALYTYKISCLAGVGDDIWVGIGNGMISVYDTTTRPWVMKKAWMAHDGRPPLKIVLDKNSIWKLDRLQVASVGMDDTIGVWDGLLEEDSLENEISAQEVDFCNYRKITASAVTWNAGACRVMDLEYRDKDKHFFSRLLEELRHPSVLVFGFQEMVDLDDKALYTKTLLKSKNKESYGAEPLGGVYRTWRDYLTRCLDLAAQPGDDYIQVHTSGLVGLFSCMFIKASLRGRVRDVQAAEVKTGNIGGVRFGNKGGLLIRMLIDDTPICVINAHLAAGQTQTSNRNEDFLSILTTQSFPAARTTADAAAFASYGGDGSQPLDHEHVLFTGDLNYRIDAMGRDAVVAAVTSGNYLKLLDRDQLTLTCRKNPAALLRAFKEEKINFAPTYKYDPDSDRYDSSEKRRVPSWCDRVLYRSLSPVFSVQGGEEEGMKQLDYKRHEMRASDHRPVSARFVLRVKSVDHTKRAEVKKQAVLVVRQRKAEMADQTKMQYLQAVFGVSRDEALRLLKA